MNIETNGQEKQSEGENLTIHNKIKKSHAELAMELFKTRKVIIARNPYFWCFVMNMEWNWKQH